MSPKLWSIIRLTPKMTVAVRNFTAHPDVRDSRVTYSPERASASVTAVVSISEIKSAVISRANFMSSSPEWLVAAPRCGPV